MFKFIITAFLEHLLHEKFSIPLFQGVELSNSTTLSMVNSDKSPSPESSPKGKYASVKQKVDRFVENARPSVKQEIEENRKFIEEKFNTSHKMWNVLMEQSEKILKLHSIKSDKDVKFYQENGGLELFFLFLVVAVIGEDGEKTIDFVMGRNEMGNARSFLLLRSC